MRLKLDAPLAGDLARRRGRFRQAAVCAALLGLASVLLLGLSGWFLAASAAAGLAGPLLARDFNYLLPAAGIRMLAIIRTASRYGERLASHDAALGVTARLRAKLFRAVADLPADRALALASGEASAHLAQDAGAIEGALVRRSALWQMLASLAAAAGMGALGGWPPVLGLGLVVLPTLWAIERLSRRLARHGAAAQRDAAALKRELGVIVQSTAELRAYRLEAWAEERIGIAARALERSQCEATAAQGLIEALTLAAIAVAGAACFALAAPHGAPVAALAALGAVMAIDGMAPFARERAAAGAVAQADARLSALLAPTLPAPTLPDGADIPPASRPADGGARPVTIDTQGRTAIRGPSGCGKTSLVERLLGLREAAAGTMFVDGRDVAAQAADSLRAQFAWCPQNAALIAGTVRDNLLLAAPGADDATLWAALDDAALRPAVERLGGLDYWVGEDGARLSGGERRRLALARAYLRPAPCLLLDEPTEGLDAETEAQVVDRLERRLARTGQGLVLVSHRAAPLRLAGQEIDLQAGVSRPVVAA